MTQLEMAEGQCPTRVSEKCQSRDLELLLALPCCPVVRKLPANAGDLGSIPGPGRFHMPWSN